MSFLIFFSCVRLKGSAFLLGIDCMSLRSCSVFVTLVSRDLPFLVSHFNW